MNFLMDRNVPNFRDVEKEEVSYGVVSKFPPERLTYQWKNSGTFLCPVAST